MPHSRPHSASRRFLSILLPTVVLLLVCLGAFRTLFPNSSGHNKGAFSSLTDLPWNLVLVNQTHAIPDDWSSDLTTLANGTQVDSRIYPQLQQMFDDMRAASIYPEVASGYRSAEKQQSLMNEKIEEFMEQGESRAQAEQDAQLWVNPVGYSEHQTGLAVDINADGIHSTGTQVYSRLSVHAWEYGFILRYPEGKTALTGTDYEPWHYRYVGKDAAKAIHDQGICLEEYLGVSQ